MNNELIFVITTLGSFGFIRYCFFQGRRWLHASIAINLILISTFGAKLIYTFGLVTNVGNIFYAMVFFAGQLLVEHYGKSEGRKSLWLGLGAVIFFVIIGQLTVAYQGIPEATGASQALETLFKFTPRVALASLLGYFFAQSLNLTLYGRLRHNPKSPIWQRSLLASASGQFLDSIIFFTVAFWGTLPLHTFLQTMFTGFAVKFFLGIISIPFLYSSYTAKTRREILEEEAEAILFSIGDGVVMTDRNGKIVLTNKSFEEMLGWQASEVIGKKITEVIKRYDEAGNIVPYKERILTHALAGEKVVTSMTNHTYFIKKDGTKLPVRIMVTPVLIDQTIMGAVEIFQDVTKENENEKMRTDFLSLASHQLRTPLSGTRWVVETLQSGILGPMNEKQQEYLNDLYQINARMMQLVSDMLDVLRIEGGNVQVAKKPFQLNKICEEIVITMQATAKKKGVLLKIAIKQQAPIILETDLKLVKSILLAFISNAISYSYPEGTVIVEAWELGNETVLVVKDNGIGIPSDEQKRIFEKFYRASNASLIKTDGTGLGLYIASVLALKIGAKITFESAEGKGSTFYLHVPKIAAPN